MAGSIVLKYDCEKCNPMPIVDGQWFLYRRNNGKQLWICTVCGCVLSNSTSPVCLGMKVGP
eukprot:2031110-Karenia_brevis.AAC.1